MPEEIELQQFPPPGPDHPAPESFPTSKGRDIIRLAHKGSLESYNPYDPLPTPAPFNPKENPPSPMASGMLGGLAQAAVEIPKAEINGAFNLGQTAMNASAMRDVATTNANAMKYRSDMDLQGVKYATDAQSRMYNLGLSQQKLMWQRDYDIANQYGLIHPAQLTGVMNNTAMTSDMYTLGSRGLSRQPRTGKYSPFSYNH